MVEWDKERDSKEGYQREEMPMIACIVILTSILVLVVMIVVRRIQIKRNKKKMRDRAAEAVRNNTGT